MCLKRVLIIDDDDDFVEATRLLLEAQGYAVITASNGQDGFAKVKQESPDIVLLDMMMSYKNEGLDVAKAIADDAASKDVPIIMITGAIKGAETALRMAQEKNNLTVKKILEKPVKPEELLAQMNNLFGKKEESRTEMRKELEHLAGKWKGKKGNLIMILHAVQNHYGYVPRDVAFELSRIINLPMARIYEVITFYSYFKLKAPGKNQISLCMGTACYLKGAQQILKELTRILKIEEGQTTEDGLFHLQVVRCLGCCGLSPVMTIGDKVYGKINEKEIMEILTPYMKEEGVLV